MKLYGTTTSPFVRRVRVVAQELGVPIERIDTATDAGQAALREVTPIRKVPVVVLVDEPRRVEGGGRGNNDGKPLFDSRVIIDYLVAQRGWGELAAPADPWHVHNLVNAIDAALDAVIQLFYLRRDGVAIDGTPYAVRQLERTDAIFHWLGTQRTPDGRGFGAGLGLAEISLVCTLDWMDFRKTYPTERAGAVESVRAAWRDRPSLVATRPHS
ncbi:MAG TPA: glutathione S-transferase family protein [Kofleriaceae bacterium]|nr:glutathione S-transferase family protein [Kofleriaceae bacterium]